MRRASSRRGADADDARARHQSSRELAREFCRRHASRSAFSPNAPTHACAHSIDARHRSRHRSIDLAHRSMGGERPIGSDRIGSDSRAPLRVARARTHRRARARYARERNISRAPRVGVRWPIARPRRDHTQCRFECHRPRANGNVGRGSRFTA